VIFVMAKLYIYIYISVMLIYMRFNYVCYHKDICTSCVTFCFYSVIIYFK
jgi:hypothetical protein